MVHYDSDGTTTRAVPSGAQTDCLPNPRHYLLRSRLRPCGTFGQHAIDVAGFGGQRLSAGPHWSEIFPNRRKKSLLELAVTDTTRAKIRLHFFHFGRGRE